MCYNIFVNWTVEYYRDSKGREPVADFINSLLVNTQAKVLRLLDLLSRYGVLLKELYTRQVRGKIRELRIKDGEGAIRILYFTYTGRRFILLHGFIKKTEKISHRDIGIAEKRMNDFLQRQGG